MGALRDAGFTEEQQGQGHTTAELSRAWNCGTFKLRRLLQAAKDHGILVVGRRQTERIDGTRLNVPVYSFVQPRKAKRGRS